MGQFLRTCMITGTPINISDWVVGFLISGDEGWTVDPAGNFAPVGGPIYGRYNGYSGITPKGHRAYHEWLWKEFQRVFDDGLLLHPSYGHKSLKDKDERLKIKSLEDVTIDADRDDPLGINLPDEDRQLIKFTLCHKWAWDIVREAGSDYVPSDEDLDFAGRGLGHMLDLKAKARDKSKDKVELRDQPSWKLFAGYLSPYVNGPWMGELKRSPISWDYNLLFSSSMIPSERIQDEAPDNLQKELEAKFKEFYAFMMGLGNIQSFIRPTHGASQSYDKKAWKKLHEAALKHLS